MNKRKKYLIKLAVRNRLLLTEDFFVYTTVFQCTRIINFAYSIGELIDDLFVINLIKEILNVNSHYIDYKTTNIIFYNKKVTE